MLCFCTNLFIVMGGAKRTPTCETTELEVLVACLPKGHLVLIVLSFFVSLNSDRFKEVRIFHLRIYNS